MLSRRILKLAVFGALPFTGLISSSATADEVFYGVRNTSSQAAPSGDPLAEQQRFLSNFSGHYLVDFEERPTGVGPANTPGASINLAAHLVGSPEVFPTPSARLIRDSLGTLKVQQTPYNGGYATSGSKFLWSQVDFTLDFTPDPQKAFGFYATDIDDRGGLITVHWDNGQSQTYTLGLPGNGPGQNLANGNLIFFGIIGDGTSEIQKVTFTGASSTDGFRIDDVVFAFDSQLAVVPLPAAPTAGMALLGVLGIGRWVRNRRRGA